MCYMFVANLLRKWGKKKELNVFALVRLSGRVQQIILAGCAYFRTEQDRTEDRTWRSTTRFGCAGSIRFIRLVRSGLSLLFDPVYRLTSVHVPLRSALNIVFEYKLFHVRQFDRLCRFMVKNWENNNHCIQPKVCIIAKTVQKKVQLLQWSIWSSTLFFKTLTFKYQWSENLLVAVQ